MSTFGTMIDRVTNELKRSDLTAEARLAIKSAIQYYEDEEEYFTETQTAINTAAGSAYYSLPTNFESMISLTLTTSNYTYPLIQRTFQWIDDHQTNDNFQGRPTEYAIFNEQIRIYPIPNQTDQLNFSFNTSFADLSATTDTNSWMTEGEELIRLRAKVDLLQNVIQGPEAMSYAGQLAAREMDVAGRLKNKTTARRTTNKIRPTQF